MISEQAGTLPPTKNPSITELLQAAAKHPKLARQRAHSEKIDKILRAFAKALDAVNDVRNGMFGMLVRQPHHRLKQ